MSRSSVLQNFAPNLWAEEEEWEKELRHVPLIFAEIHVL